MSEQGEHPQGVGRPPVEVVAVEDDGVAPSDALVGHQRCECLRIPVVTDERIVQFGVPVDLDRTGNVAGLIQEHVLIGLDHDQAGLVEMLGEPIGRDQLLGMGVLLEVQSCVVCNHDVFPPRPNLHYGDSE